MIKKNKKSTNTKYNKFSINKLKNYVNVLRHIYSKSNDQSKAIIRLNSDISLSKDVYISNCDLF